MLTDRTGLEHPIRGGNYTIGDLMVKTGLARARVNYILETRRIKPVTKLGSANVYDNEAVSKLMQAINEIDFRRPTTTERIASIS